MKIHWLSAGRHYLQVIAFCFVVAVLTTAIWPNKTYLVQVGYALSVGTVVWGVIEFGRYLVDERNCHSDSSGGHGWPKGWRGVLLTAVGIGCGFLVGDRVGDFLFSHPNVSSPRDNTISLLITIVASAAASFYFHARGRAAALTAKIAIAERDAGEARLKLLEAQLEPHMLFNTLANLRALIAVDPPRAIEMLDHLNGYLRVTLAGSRATSHPLASEFDRLRDYLELMSVRMGPRLRYSLDLPDSLRGQPVPSLLLQPLVENSIRHGLEPKVEGGDICVRARREERAEDGVPRICIEVRDTGVGLGSAPASNPEGFGIEQVRERLVTVYGARGGLTLQGAPDGGAIATVTFPA